MKIKIPPYPNYIFPEHTFKNGIQPHLTGKTKTDKVNLSNNLVMIVEQNGQMKLIKSRPVTFNEKKFVAPFPNPVHLFLSLAIEHYNHSEKIKIDTFFTCGKEWSNDYLILEAEINGTHECYNQYIKYRISSIIMLATSLETFSNHVLPNDFIYERKDDGKKYKKKDIESTTISLKEKIEKVIPQWKDSTSFWSEFQSEFDVLSKILINRKNLIHLKTNSDDGFDRYFPAIDQMLDFNIAKAIEVVIWYMNSISDNFIKQEIKP